MKKPVNSTTELGIDTVEVTIDKKIDTYITEIKSEDQARVLSRVQPIQNGTRIALCLPKAIRQNNEHPFGLLDACHLLEMVRAVERTLQKLQVDTVQAKVTKVEINATATLEDPAHVPAILQLFAMMFLQSGQKAFLVVHGEQDKMFQNVPLEREIMRTRPVVESIKTARLSNHRFCWKVYNKGLESKIKDRGVLRIEQVHSRESLQYAGVPDVLRDFLAIENITKLVNLYRRDYRDYFIDCFWRDKATGTTFPEMLVNTIVSTLETERPLATALMHRDLLAIDFSLFEKAVLSHYGPGRRKQALQAVRRVRQSGRVETKEGSITELVQVCRAIVM